MEQLAEISQKLHGIEENLVKNNKVKKIRIGIGLVSLLVACGEIATLLLTNKVEWINPTLVAEGVAALSFSTALWRINKENFLKLHQQALRIDKIDLEVELEARLEREAKLPPFSLPQM